MAKWNHQSIAFSVEQADAFEYKADVLVLKFARAHFGLDRAVSSRLVALGESPDVFMPAEGETELIKTRGALGVKYVVTVHGV